MWLTGDRVNRQDGPDGKVVISLSLNHRGMSSHLVEVKVLHQFQPRVSRLDQVDGLKRCVHSSFICALLWSEQIQDEVVVCLTDSFDRLPGPLPTCPDRFHCGCTCNYNTSLPL